MYTEHIYLKIKIFFALVVAIILLKYLIYKNYKKLKLFMDIQILYVVWHFHQMDNNYVLAAMIKLLEFGIHKQEIQFKYSKDIIKKFLVSVLLLVEIKFCLDPGIRLSKFGKYNLVNCKKLLQIIQVPLID